MQDQKVVHNETKKRFEYRIDDSLAVIEYKITGNKILLLSTQVPSELSGKGVGSNLVRQSIELIEKMNLEVVPVCSFIQAWMRKNPEKQHLLA